MQNKLGQRVIGDPCFPDSFDLQIKARNAVEKAAEPNDLALRLHVEFEYVLEETMVRLPSLVLQSRLPIEISLDI